VKGSNDSDVLYFVTILSFVTRIQWYLEHAESRFHFSQRNQGVLFFGQRTIWSRLFWPTRRSVRWFWRGLNRGERSHPRVLRTTNARQYIHYGDYRTSLYLILFWSMSWHSDYERWYGMEPGKRTEQQTLPIPPYVTTSNLSFRRNGRERIRKA